MPTVTLICATKNRPSHVSRRIRLWCRSVVDAVLIVDGTADPKLATEIVAVCQAPGVAYVRFPPSARDTRTKQKNLGARMAGSNA